MTAKESPSLLLPEPITGQEWRADAACLGHDPEIWFPEDGDEEIRDEAVRICRGCPVREECLEWSLAVDDHFAILGGLTKRQRTALRKRITRWGHSMAWLMPGSRSKTP